MNTIAKYKVKQFQFLIGFLILLIFLPFLYSIFYPWTNMQCTRQKVDLNTGLIKIEKYYWHINYSTEIKNSFISKTLNLTRTNNPKWVSVNTFSIGHNNSPHYKYHNLLNSIKNIELLSMKLNGLNDQEKKQISSEFVEIMKNSKNDSFVRDFIDKIDKKYDPKTKY